MDDLRQQPQTRVSRPSRSSLFLAVAAGVLGALLHSVVLPLAMGSGTAFLTFAALLAGGIGLAGSCAGVVAARLLPIGRVGRIISAGAVTFAATLAIGSLPGLIGGLGRAVFVSVGVVCALALIEWLQGRAIKPQTS